MKNVLLVKYYIGYGDTISCESFEQQLLAELSFFTASDGGTRNSNEISPFPNGDNYEISSGFHSHNHTMSSRASGEEGPSIPLTSRRDHIVGAATEKPITYIIRKDKLYIRNGSNPVRRLLLGPYVYLKNRDQNRLARLNVPVDRLIRVGFSTQV